MSGILKIQGVMPVLLGLLQAGASSQTATPTATSTEVPVPSPVIVDIHRD